MHSKQSITQLLHKSAVAVERGLIVLYELQTVDERVSSTSTHRNGAGFNAIDAQFLSSLAQQIQRKQGEGVKLGFCLSQKQLNLARTKIVRYAGQLADVANAKLEKVGAI